MDNIKNEDKRKASGDIWFREVEDITKIEVILFDTNGEEMQTAILNKPKKNHWLRNAYEYYLRKTIADKFKDE